MCDLQKTSKYSNQAETIACPGVEESCFWSLRMLSLFSKSFRNQNIMRCHGNGTQIYHWSRSRPGWWCHHSFSFNISSCKSTWADRHVLLCILYKLENAGDECGCVLRICVVQMMCLLCNAALPGMTARVQMMSELRLKGSILLQSTFRIQCVFGQVWFNVNGSAGDTVQKRFCMFILYKICGVQKSNNASKNDPIFF